MPKLIQEDNRIQQQDLLFLLLYFNKLNLKVIPQTAYCIDETSMDIWYLAHTLILIIVNGIDQDGLAFE